MLTAIISVYIIFALITFFLLRKEAHIIAVIFYSLFWFLLIPLLIGLILIIVIEIFSVIIFCNDFK